MNLEAIVRRAVIKVTAVAHQLAKEERDEGGAIVVVSSAEPHPKRAVARGLFWGVSPWIWSVYWPDLAMEAALLGPSVYVERVDELLFIGVAGMPKPCIRCIEEAVRLEIMKALEDTS
jgi:hypothetical protein